MNANSNSENSSYNILKLPFDIVKYPFKSYREYYGKPKQKETYKGTFFQKQRLRKVLPFLLQGEEITGNDIIFLDMFNDFLSQEGHEPMDQSNTVMKCKNCEPYLYKSNLRSSPTTKKEKEEDEDDDDEESSSNYKVYQISFNEKLEPKDSKIIFKKNSTYRLLLVGSQINNGVLELYFTNKKFKKGDYLIFKTKVKDPFRRFIDYNVYQNNNIIPLKLPIFLGTIPVKIY